MKEQIKDLVEFVRLHFNEELSPQQIKYAEFLFNNPTVCYSIFARRAGHKFVFDAIEEMEKTKC